ncbi:MAG: divergent polysaccharide deacetylase family protein [Candidatus Omnitrophica bacterium]|nr:divergent polysaccharide deacetylase family protein [Candidatus Omnitrophota bacterium]MDD5352580.1 divergent polysaccharide deacetylase family protein [Candidatus Omnitrophota bacterium]MDD5550178.1 divergent polysaccharide deacetylase family protein [Candidatus Omnitrophota bacterium]
MPLFRHKRRRHKSSHGIKNRSNSFTIGFLSLILLFETILLLFLIPKTPTTKAPSVITKKKFVKVEAQRVIVKKPVKKMAQKIVPRKIKGKIAIVIDDWGYNADDLEMLKEIKLPLTLAILPFRYYSHRIAEFAHAHNYEVIIHMPMEPDDKEKVGLEPKTLMISMNPEKIKTILNEALNDIPYAEGVNNHMGSLATTNKAFIRTVFKELKQHNLYFLDSFVAPDSVCRDVAKELGIKFSRRSIFLDNKPDPEYIRGQLMELVKEVDEKGEAIGIGHDKDNTLLILKETMPQLDEAGYEFVFVSELID